MDQGSRVLRSAALNLFPLSAVHVLPVPARPPRLAAFSLTEVVIALGIFAVAMIGVLALFPVASSTGRESSEETQATILANTILSDFRASAISRGGANAWLVSGKNTFGNFISPVDLTQAQTYVIAYDIKRRDVTDSPGWPGLIGPPIALKATNQVAGGNFSAAAPGAAYLCRIQTRPVAGLARLSSVTVDVSTPGDVAQANRRIYSFQVNIYAP